MNYVLTYEQYQELIAACSYLVQIHDHITSVSSGYKPKFIIKYELGIISGNLSNVKTELINLLENINTNETTI